MLFFTKPIFLISALAQGVSEGFPVSSSAHLMLVRHMLGVAGNIQAWGEFLTLDIVLHGGSFCALLWVFALEARQSLWGIWIIVELFFKNFTKRFGKKRLQGVSIARSCTLVAHGERYWTLRFVLLLFCSSIPAGVMGIFLKFIPDFHHWARNVFVTSLNSMVFGVLLALVALGWGKPRGKFSQFLGRTFFSRSQRYTAWRIVATTLPFSWAWILGCAQGLALVPGVSRLGVCITAGCILGMGPFFSTYYGFLMGAPVMFLALLSKTKAILLINGKMWEMLVAPWIITIFLNIFCMGWCLRYCNNFLFSYFGVYRLFLGIFMVFFYFFL